MIYKRSILPQIEKYIEKKEIIVLTGMRRVGKTTLLKQVFDGIKSENKITIKAKDLPEKGFDVIVLEKS